MTDRLPDPLSPPGCDLAGNDWFPFYFDRLRKSKWWRRASDTARARNVMMWGEAYKAIPAGSLPNDEDDLAEAAGYGLDVAAFNLHRDEIMEPWVLCSDGRWYHPTMCEVAAEAWNRLSDKRRGARQRKQAERDRLKEARDLVTPKTTDVTRDKGEIERDAGVKPAETEGVSRVTEPEKGVTSPHRQTDRQTPQDRTSSDPSDRPAQGDPDAEAWTRGVALLERAGSKTGPARSFFGGLLKTTKLQARDLLPSIIKAEMNGTQDPRAYLTAAGLAITERKGAGDAPPADTTSWGDPQWRTALRIYRAEGLWDAELGPEPGLPGCRVPSRLCEDLIGAIG